MRLLGHLIVDLMQADSAGVASQAFDALLADEGSHQKSSEGIGPPEAEEHIEEQATQKDRGEIGAELGLLGVGMHRGAAKDRAKAMLGAREHRHHDERSAGHDDAGDAMLGCAFEPKSGCGFVPDVGGQRQKTTTDDFESVPLILLPALHVGIDCHTPQDGATGSNFDKAVDAKADERNAAGDRAGDDGCEAFQ